MEPVENEVAKPGTQRPTGEVVVEGKGLDYERLALHRLFARQVEEHGLKTICEIPARGEKAKGLRQRRAPSRSRKLLYDNSFP